MQTKKGIGNTANSTTFLEAAKEIGDQLIKLAVKDDRQISWKTIDRQRNTVEYDHNDLYSGASGIGLFFIELYKHTHQKKHLQIARMAIRTAATREKAKQHNYSAFITGRMGVAYTLLKLYEVTNDRIYLKQALALAKACRGAFSTAHEYLSGNAGIMLCLLHLHAASKEPWLLELINEYVEQILKGVQSAETGVFWDRYPYQIRPLCGFSHGVAGIGFIFLELGRYLKNPAYYAIAEQAFAYENAYFDKSTNNWPDFRLDMWEDQKIVAFEEAYAQGNIEAFTKAPDMVAWCHGAPGIGLSRILAYRLTHKRMYLDDLNRALATTKATDMHDPSLCHGSAGNLETFIESYAVLGRKRDWAYALSAGESLLKQWEWISQMQTNKTFIDQQDPSLFTGLAGLGYSLLRLQDPYRTPSILAPRLSAVLPAKPDSKLHFLRLSRNEVESILSEDNPTEARRIKQIKREMIAEYPSSGLLFIKSRIQGRMIRKILQLSDSELLEQSLHLNEDCRMYVAAQGGGVLLRYTPQNIEQKSITLFCYAVLAAFKEPRKVRSVITAIAERYGYTAAEQQELLQSKALEQIRQALSAMLLLPKI